MTVDETQRCDVLVVGGGVAAICAAVQAARLGCRTILLEKDPLLGGNGGPLLGVHISGAHSFHPYASELGIIGEILEEAAWQRAKIRTHGLHYNIHPQFETILHQTLVDAGVTVYRRTYARDAAIVTLPDGRRRITAVIAEDTARFKTVRFEVGTAVIDGSGDGHVAARAGASLRRGREAASETGERSAVAVADQVTMGNSVTALVRRSASPVEFIAPPGTPPFEAGYGRSAKTSSDGRRTFSISSWRPDAEFCFLWITETGGQGDTIENDHAIFDELYRHVYSTWAAVKAEQPGAAEWELVWISPKAGKRESRRFLGDVVVSQTDVESGRPWPDAVCYGGYSIDIHNPAGRDDRQVDIVFYSIPPLWSMPYRALYSRDVANLWLAGRLASTTHLGLGSWRLMRTLASGGQAVGAAAALAHRHACDNRTVGEQHLDALQETILRHGGGIVGRPSADPLDLARGAAITATSESRHAVTEHDRWLACDRPRGVQLWDWSPRLETVELYLLNESDEPAELTLEVAQHVPAQPWKEDHTGGRFSYEPVANRLEWGAHNEVGLFAPRGGASAVIPPRFVGWVRFAVGLDLDPPDPTSDEPRVNLVLAPAAGVSWAVSGRRYDFARRLWLDPEAAAYGSAGDSHGYRLDPAPPYGEAANVANGWNRRFSTNPLHAWQADPAAPLPQALTLRWPAPQAVAEVQLTFDTLTRAYQEMPFDCGQRASPRCVRDYRVEVCGPDGAWREVVREQDNHHGRRVHAWPATWLSAVRVVVERVWDEVSPARLVEVRAYGPAGPEEDNP